MQIKVRKIIYYKMCPYENTSKNSRKQLIIIEKKSSLGCLKHFISAVGVKFQTPLPFED